MTPSEPQAEPTGAPARNAAPTMSETGGQGAPPAGAPAGGTAASPAAVPGGVTAEFSARVPRLLEAMRSIGTGLELRSTLDRICETAAELASARYTAIGVVDEAGDGFSDFV